MSTTDTSTVSTTDTSTVSSTPTAVTAPVTTVVTNTTTGTTVPVLTVPLGNFYTSINAPADKSSITITAYALYATGLAEATVTARTNGANIEFPSIISSTDSSGSITTVPVIGVKLPDGTRKIGTPQGIVISDVDRAAASARISQKNQNFVEIRTAAAARANLRKSAGSLPLYTGGIHILTASQLTNSAPVSTDSDTDPVITAVTGASAVATATETPYSVSSQLAQDQSDTTASEMVTKEYYRVY